MKAQDAWSVVDPLQGEAHDLPTATERLWEALREGDVDALRRALRFRPDLNARYQTTEQDEILREQGEDPELEDYERPPEPLPLEYCLQQNRLDLAEVLLKAGANPDGEWRERRWGAFLLGQAIRHSVDAMDLLIRHGATVNPVDPATFHIDRTPLGEAVTTGQLDRVQRLLDAGAWVNLPKQLPASYAGPQARHRWTTPLGVALEKLDQPGIEAIAERLLAAGSSVTQVSSFGTNALHHLGARNPSWVARLVTLGADPQGRNAHGATPLHLVIPPLHSPSAQAPHEATYQGALEALVAQGADLNALDDDGRTPLLNALRGYAPLGVVRWMLDHGANPDWGKPNGFGPSARQHLMNSLDDWRDEHGYAEKALIVLVEAEQQALRTLAERASISAASTVPARRRARL